MQDKLSEKELVRLVEVVSQLDEERKQMLDRNQLAQILRDLNMSDDLLDEAMVRLEQGKLTAQRKRKTISIAAVIAACVIAAAAALMFSTTSYNNQLAQITSSETRITSMSEANADLSAVPAGTGVIANVTLQNVPQGARIPLHARWIQPDGTVYHESSWQTKPADKRTWQTHAKADIRPSAPKGDWSVQFVIGDRVVATKKFVVN